MERSELWDYIIRQHYLRHDHRLPMYNDGGLDTNFVLGTFNAALALCQSATRPLLERKRRVGLCLFRGKKGRGSQFPLCAEREREAAVSLTLLRGKREGGSVTHKGEKGEWKSPLLFVLRKTQMHDLVTGKYLGGFTVTWSTIRPHEQQLPITFMLSFFFQQISLLSFLMVFLVLDGTMFGKKKKKKKKPKPVSNIPSVFLSRNSLPSPPFLSYGKLKKTTHTYLGP